MLLGKIFMNPENILEVLEIIYTYLFWENQVLTKTVKTLFNFISAQQKSNERFVKDEGLSKQYKTALELPKESNHRRFVVIKKDVCIENPILTVSTNYFSSNPITFIQ